MIVFKCSDGSHLHLPGLGTDQKCSDSPPPHIWSSTPFDSVSLNIFLTLIIIIRLVLHVRNIRAAMGTAGIGGLCKSIVTILMSIVPSTVQQARCCLLYRGLAETQLRVSSWASSRLLDGTHKTPPPSVRAHSVIPGMINIVPLGVHRVGELAVVPSTHRFGFGFGFESPYKFHFGLGYTLCGCR